MAGGQAIVGAKTQIPRITGLARERLDRKLASLWNHRLGLVVAPAGSGKTTLVAQFAARAGVPVAWWRAEPSDGSASAAIAHLERAAVSAFAGMTGGWESVDDAAAAFDAWAGSGDGGGGVSGGGGRGLIAVDDLHSLWGTEAEAALERLLALLPASVVVLAASRRAPGFNLPRLLVSGDVLEIGPDDLRFRSWEVEGLFRDFYGSPMLPGELAELARRTAGWAAGLQLFHLATRGKPAPERRRLLAQLGVRSRLLREYLARNVLDEMPIHVRDFLVRTCVLGRLTPALCDDLTGATSSDVLLVELEQRQIFTAALDDEGSYRYHEVLRSYLEGVLVEHVGEAEARARFLHAGALLERHGYLADAIRAYGRAEAWEAVTRLLGGRAEEVVDRPGDWIEALPSALLDHDPWLLLGLARRLAALGQADAAIDAYRRAEDASAPGQPSELCRRERQAVGAWFAPAPATPSDWVGALRRATVRDPLTAAAWSGAEADLVAGVSSLLAGRLDEAEARLDALGSSDTVSPVMAVGAAVAAFAARVVSGRCGSAAVEADRLGEHAEAAGLPWLAAVARAIALGDPAVVASDLRSAALPKDDPWGSAITRLFAGLGATRRPSGDEGLDAVAVLDDAIDGFRALDAPVLGAWAAAVRAVAERSPVSMRRATQAALRLGVDVSSVVAVHSRSAGAGLGGAAGDGRVAVRCFGPFRVTVDGAGVDLAAIKPRVRSLVRLLALHDGELVHRERIIECLWPDEPDVRVGTRNLQVAVSALRQLIEPGVARGEAALVVREGDAYRLALVGDDASDLREFRAALERGRVARSTGDTAAAIAAYRDALHAHAGELLADEGPAEWVADERDRCRFAAAEAAQTLAELLLDAGDHASAVEAADRGLRLDTYRDGLWRALVAAYDAAGDRAAAGRASARYAEVLAELGVD